MKTVCPGVASTEIDAAIDVADAGVGDDGAMARVLVTGSSGQAGGAAAVWTRSVRVGTCASGPRMAPETLVAEMSTAGLITCASGCLTASARDAAWWRVIERQILGQAESMS